MVEVIQYIYEHRQTDSTTGYFACVPVPALSPSDLLQLIVLRPLDSFLRRHALAVFAGFDEDKLQENLLLLKSMAKAASNVSRECLAGTNEEFKVSNADGCKALSSFLCELSLAQPALKECITKQLQEFRQAEKTGVTVTGAAQSNPHARSGHDSCGCILDDAKLESSPLLYLRRESLPDAWLHNAWGRLFEANIQTHKKLPSGSELAGQGLPPLFTDEVLERFAKAPEFNLKDLFSAFCLATEGNLDSASGALGLDEPAQNIMPPTEVAELALERLHEVGAIAGGEQRHIASLSPIGLLMPWQLDITVQDGRNKYRLTGEANTYGRGLSLPQARASCRMEMIERFSAYLSVDALELADRAQATPLIRARRSELLGKGDEALDPNAFYIESPYMDQQLVWIRGETVRRNTPRAHLQTQPVWVPLQMASLFSNCDEVDLCSAPGSTGLATGSTVEQARLAALIEVLERDSEATCVYHKERCFQLDHRSLPSGEPYDVLAELLADYRSLGINLQFMDITAPLGLPCYQAFVIGPKGEMHRGHGAALSGVRALISALTETPYPYPEGGPSGPMLRNLPLRKLNDLPNYSTATHGGDLALLESLLCANNLNPTYVNLTHSKLKFPVVRALVPGMQPMASFDEFSRISPRLYKDYLRFNK